MKNTTDNQTEDVDRLRALLRDADCPVAAAEPLAASLHWSTECDVAAWSHRVMARAALHFEAQAQRVWRRQVAVFVGLAIVALPLTLVAGAYGTLLLYQGVCSLLPASVATYLVATYAMVALGVVGATYAAIPVAVGRSHDRLVLAQSFAATFSPTTEDPQ